MKHNKKFDNSVNRTTDIENINEVNVAENDLPLLSEPTEVAEVTDEVVYNSVSQEESADDLSANAVDPQTYVIRLLEGIYLNTQETALLTKSSSDKKEYLEVPKEDYDKLEEANAIMGGKYSSALADNRDLRNIIVDINSAITEAFNEDGVDDINIPDKFSFWWVVSNASSIFTLVKKIVTIVKENKKETNQKFGAMLEANRIKL